MCIMKINCFGRSMKISGGANFMRAIIFAQIFCLSLSACGDDVPDHAVATGDVAISNSKYLALPPRLQWRENFGYCGEVAIISAGLYYGQYISQYDARAIAGKNTPQDRRDSQLLLGVNDAYAAAQMHLKAIQWSPDAEASADGFLVWVKNNILNDYPVLIGLYTNHYLFDGSRDVSDGDSEYDHIVPVVGVVSKNKLTRSATYFGDDVIVFSDNGLWPVVGDPGYFFGYSFDDVRKNRAQANARQGNVYSLARDARNYGIAISGVIDEDHETVPGRVAVSRNDEKPNIGPGSGLRPAAIPLTLTVEVSGLRPGVNYKLYRYNHMEAVPNSAFNANAAQADKQWDVYVASGGSYVVTEKIRSSDVAVYRAVRADGR